jgi:putative ABC transport system ATP-binding protein
VSIELRAVRKVYHGSPPVPSLRGVNLMIAGGEQVAIVGASGSGKSTLLNLMAGLDRATAGTVRIADVDVATFGDRALSGLRATHVGVIFQGFHLLESLTATENVATGLLYRGVPARQRMSRARIVLDQVGLANRADHRPGRLSGGERQRVAIARALIGTPTVLLADEPTGNLYTATGRHVLALLRWLGANGTTLIVATHDPDVAAAMDRRIVIRDGLIVADTGEKHP